MLDLSSDARTNIQEGSACYSARGPKTTKIELMYEYVFSKLEPSCFDHDLSEEDFGIDAFKDSFAVEYLAECIN